MLFAARYCSASSASGNRRVNHARIHLRIRQPWQQDSAVDVPNR